MEIISHEDYIKEQRSFFDAHGEYRKDNYSNGVLFGGITSCFFTDGSYWKEEYSISFNEEVTIISKKFNAEFTESLCIVECKFSSSDRPEPRVTYSIVDMNIK